MQSTIEHYDFDFNWNVAFGFQMESACKKRPSNIFQLKKFQSIPKLQLLSETAKQRYKMCKGSYFLLMTVLALGEMGVFIFSTVEYCISWYFCWLNVLKVSLSIKHTLSVSVGAFSKRIKYLLLLIKAELLVDPTGMKTWMGQQKETISIKLNTVLFLFPLNKLK